MIPPAVGAGVCVRLNPALVGIIATAHAQGKKGLGMRVVVSLLAAALLSGCVTNEVVKFSATNPNQQSMVRDGRPALVSRQKNSIVLVSTAGRNVQTNGRPVFVVGITNMSKQPIDFRVDQVEVMQNVGGQPMQLAVITYEQLVQEEKTRQVAAAILTGVAAGANAYSASRAGYGTYTTPGGRTGSFYSPTAAAIAQGNAAAQNEAMISANIERGQQNMAMLEQAVIKDNTLMPGEWYGGQLHLSPPANPAQGPKIYSIALLVGGERHVIDVSQVAEK